MGGESNVRNAQHFAGTVGQRLEELTIKTSTGTIRAQGHVQGVGWTSVLSGKQINIGSTGQSRRLEAIKLSLEGVPGYAIRYMVRLEGRGWTDWAYQGQWCGTTGESLRMEAIVIEIIETSSIPSSRAMTIAGINKGNEIRRNTVLNAGDYLLSPSGEFQAYMQHDGNFVIYNVSIMPYKALWASNTVNRSETGRYFFFQNDGNLVVYSTTRTPHPPVWSPNIHGRGAERLVMQNDGNLVAYTSQGVAVWDSGTWGSQLP
jgi:uncharacterized protein YjdB